MKKSFVTIRIGTITSPILCELPQAEGPFACPHVSEVGELTQTTGKSDGYSIKGPLHTYDETHKPRTWL